MLFSITAPLIHPGTVTLISVLSPSVSILWGQQTTLWGSRLGCCPTALMKPVFPYGVHGDTFAL